MSRSNEWYIEHIKKLHKMGVMGWLTPYLGELHLGWFDLGYFQDEDGKYKVYRNEERRSKIIVLETDDLNKALEKLWQRCKFEASMHMNYEYIDTHPEKVKAFKKWLEKEEAE